VTADFLLGIFQGKRQWNQIFKVQNENKNKTPRPVNLEFYTQRKYISKKRQNKDFLQNQKSGRIDH
jgi:hypothetical protein